MFRSLCLLLALACLSLGSSVEEWSEYKVKFEKEYSGEEDDTRFALWVENKKLVDDHNKEGQGFRMSLNEYSDWTQEEVNMRLLGYTHVEDSTMEEEIFEDDATPDLLDYREHNFVTEVKNQGGCGSCWAFSATGGMEGMWAKQHGELISMSEQQLLDCGPGSCDGGHMVHAWDTAKAGIMSEEDYPYEHADKNCRFDSNKVVASTSGHKSVSHNEDSLEQALVQVGYPISVAIHVGNSFQHYKDGIYSDPECVNGKLNHGVLVVGYNKTVEDEAYWIVKNSWGKNWGMDGYILMKMGENSCGIAKGPCYPVLEE